MHKYELNIMCGNCLHVHLASCCVVRKFCVLLIHGKKSLFICLVRNYIMKGLLGGRNYHKRFTDVLSVCKYCVNVKFSSFFHLGREGIIRIARKVFTTD